jgi:hypothetical protein
MIQRLLFTDRVHDFASNPSNFFATQLPCGIERLDALSDHFVSDRFGRGQAVSDLLVYRGCIHSCQYVGPYRRRRGGKEN